eukprot:3027027-Rhodomonas_salina.2
MTTTAYATEETQAVQKSRKDVFRYQGTRVPLKTSTRVPLKTSTRENEGGSTISWRFPKFHAISHIPSLLVMFG